MIVHVKLDDRLSILRVEDRTRAWKALDDQCFCILCEKKFNGRQVEIQRFANGKYELRCPSEGCHSGPHQWVCPGTPLISDIIEPDWWHTVGKQPRRRLTKSRRRARGQRV
jgi:hypothetical protein